METTLGPIVNSKKLYLQRHMTELVDELFEHPKPRNDDIMDALYYADYYARAPKSQRMSKDEIETKEDETRKFTVKKTYNWITGSRNF
jgi:hypothetical protein